MKDILIGKQEHERMCPECGEDVWIEWEESPNLKCSACGHVDTVKSCDNCGGIMPTSAETEVCNDCYARAMED